MIEQLFLRRVAKVASSIALSLELATSLLIGPSMATEEPRTGSLVPGGGGSSMVQESGRLRSSDRAPIGNAAAKRRTANEAHDTLRRFASCLVSGADATSERRAIVEFLRTSSDDPKVIGKTNKIVRENCLYGTGADSALLRFQPDILRGAIFRQLYLDVGRTSPARIASGDVLGNRSAEVSGTFAANQRFGACIVAAAPSAADGFVRAKVASVEQDAALRGVMAQMSGCLTQGLTLQMSRVVLDGLLAEALYRHAVAPGGLQNPSPGQVAPVK